jgi:ABC-type sugar transport system ATPase subunit
MLGQRLVVLSGRRLHQTGTAQDVWDVPATRAVLGSLSETGVNWLSGRVVRTSAGWSFRGDGCEFELTGEALHRWQQLVGTGVGNEPSGEPVVVGIRPTELTLASALDADRNQGTVTRVDWWGDRRVVQVRLTDRMPTRGADDRRPGTVVRVVTSHHQTVQLGSTVTVQSGSDRLYFFDRQTGQNLQLLSAIASDGKVRQR